MQPSCVSIMLLKPSQAISSLVRFSLGAHITEGSARSERLVVMRFSIVGIATTKLRLSIDMRFLAMNGKKVICSMCNTELDVSIYALLKFIQHANETNNIFLLVSKSLELLNAAIFDKECEPQWQIYLVLLGLFLALAIAFYMFFQNFDSFWKLLIARDQTARPKIEAILGDPQSEDQWGAFGLLDM
ncbi:hypothetical protein LguiB_032252 [Lonicera macranthoides]